MPTKCPGIVFERTSVRVRRRTGRQGTDVAVVVAVAEPHLAIVNDALGRVARGERRMVPGRLRPRPMSRPTSLRQTRERRGRTRPSGNR